MKLGCQVLCLDFDGVVLESVDLKDRAYYDLFSHLKPAERRKVLELHRDTPGMKRADKIAWLFAHSFGRAPSELEREGLGRRYSMLVLAGLHSCRPVAGIEEFLASSRVPAYVVSAAPEDEVRAVIQTRRWNMYFAGVMGSPRTKAALLDSIIDGEDVEPAQVLFIGDRPTDLDAARSVSCTFVGRVPMGAANPFPPETCVIPDFLDVQIRLAAFG